MAGSFSSPVGGARLILRILCFAIGIVAIICLSLAVDYIGLGLTTAAVFWSLIHIIFLEIKKELHPAFSIAFDLIAAAITFVYAILVIVAMIKFKSTGINDSYLGAVEIGSGALMIITGLFHFIFFVVACCDLHNRRRRPLGNMEKFGN